MKTKRIALIATLAAAGLGLASCGGHKDAADTTNTDATETNYEAAPVNMTEVPAEAPQATQIDNASTEATPAPAAAPQVSASEQTQDDADATGMTARVSRDEGGNEQGDVAK